MKGTLAALAIFALLASCPSALAADVDGTDGINATVTETGGLYHVLPVFKELTRVAVYPKKGPYDQEHTRILERGTGYTYFPNKGNLILHVPVDAEKDHVSVKGVRVLPWAWRVRHTLVPGSVRVLIGKREGVEGKDYAVSAADGIFRFLDPALCTRKLRYHISYREKGRPDNPEKVLYCGVGNHSDRELLRRFHAGEDLGAADPGGEPEPAVPAAPRALNAMPTEERGIYHMTQVFSSVVTVRVVARGTGAGRNLDAAEWAYDKARGRLLITAEIDDKLEMVIARGSFAVPWVWAIPKPFVPGSVRMLLGNRVAVEGVDFAVDVKTRTVRLLGDAAKSTTHYYMRWLYPKDPERPDYSPSGSIGNHPDRAAVRKFITNR